MRKHVGVVLLGITGIFSAFVLCLVCAQAKPALAESLESRYEEQLREIKLITSMESALFAASEAEKLAVMAETDEDSQTYADMARSIEDTIARSRQELSSLVQKEKLDKESALLTEFDACWQEFRKLDEEILNLAVKNTNLKAAQLSHGQAMALLGRLKETLRGITPEKDDPLRELRLQVLKDRVLLAVQQVQILQAPHIEESDPKKMDALEERIKALESRASKALEDMTALTGENDKSLAQAASVILDEYTRTTAEIVTLSRQNTNVDSLKLSLGRKRAATASCSEILAALKKAAFDRSFKATR